MKILKYLQLFFLSILISNISIGQKDIDSLLIRLEAIIKDNDIPGAMISIVRSDSTIYQGGVGYANLQNKEVVTDKHLFRLGSITKSLTALGFLKLVSENKITLSTTIEEIDNTLNIPNKWKDEHPITLEQILEHTAGFDEMHNHARNNNGRYEETPTGSDLVKAHSKSLYSRWKPGERMAYSNPGYVLAGHLLEQITNQKYSQFLEQEVMVPLGMNNSTFLFKNNPELLTAKGYLREGGSLSPISFNSVLAGAAGDLCSNAEDMALFLRYMLTRKIVNTNETLIKPDLIDRMENPQTTIAAKKGIQGGYGLANSNLWSNNYQFHGHDGGIDGFSSIYLYSREADFGLAISINTQGKIWKLQNEILNFYLGENTYNNFDSQPISEEIKEKYSGYYDFKSPRTQTMYFLQKFSSGHILEFDQDYLLVKDFTGTTRDTLIHKGNNQYYRPSENIPFVALMEDENKTLILWLGKDYFEKGNQATQITILCLLIMCIFFIVLNFLLGVIGWLIRIIRKDESQKKNRTVLLLSSFSFVVLIMSFILTTELYNNPSSINIGSITVFLSSIIFFLFSIFSLYKTFRQGENSLFYRWYYRLSAVSLSVIAFWFLSNNLIGFMLWVY